MELQELVDEVAKAEVAKREAIELYERAAWELTRMMQSEGATEAVSDTHKATLTATNSYDQGKLHSVLELVPEADLVDAAAYVPEHEETRTVQARWNATKLKPFSKRGVAVQEAIASARVEGEPRLKLISRS
jgi:hypothetical protein